MFSNSTPGPENAVEQSKLYKKYGITIWKHWKKIGQKSGKKGVQGD